MKNSLILFAMLILLSACSKKEQLSTNECNNLQTAISEMNETVLEQEINELCNDLSPQSTTSDPTGHEDNINTLISRFETNCEIEAELVCYACIKTFPAQSEIKLTVTLPSGTYVKIIDISTPDDKKLTYEGIHN